MGAGRKAKPKKMGVLKVISPPLPSRAKARMSAVSEGNERVGSNGDITAVVSTAEDTGGDVRCHPVGEYLWR